MEEEIVWNDKYKIGIKEIDNAHKQLFTVIQRLMKINQDKEKTKWVSVEGIKYFKSYALKHFAEEEAYMRSVGYRGYARHKQLHDNMRNKTIPLLENSMIMANYSTGSVNHFLTVSLRWLSQHIMKEDQAIPQGGSRR